MFLLYSIDRLIHVVIILTLLPIILNLFCLLQFRGVCESHCGEKFVVSAVGYVNVGLFGNLANGCDLVLGEFHLGGPHVLFEILRSY